MELAFLLRVPLYELLEKMTWQEWAMWSLYFYERPVGWKEDQRTYMLLRAQGVKADSTAVFSSLAQLKKAEQLRSKDQAIVPRSGSALHTAMLNAKGGDKLEFLKDL